MPKGNGSGGKKPPRLSKPRKAKKDNSKKNRGLTFCRFFIHWRTKKLMDAWEYGYKAWPIGRRA